MYATGIGWENTRKKLQEQVKKQKAEIDSLRKEIKRRGPKESGSGTARSRRRSSASDSDCKEGETPTLAIELKATMRRDSESEAAEGALDGIGWSSGSSSARGSFIGGENVMITQMTTEESDGKLKIGEGRGAPNASQRMKIVRQREKVRAEKEAREAEKKIVEETVSQLQGENVRLKDNLRDLSVEMRKVMEVIQRAHDARKSLEIENKYLKEELKQLREDTVVALQLVERFREIQQQKTTGEADN